jgi:ADP-heptose:LPS heptosyltransferase
VNRERIASLPEGGKLLIFMLHGVGDQIMSTPAIKALKDLRPDVQLVIATSEDRRLRDLWRLHPSVSEAIEVPHHPRYYHPLYRLTEELPLERALREIARREKADEFIHVRLSRLPQIMHRALRYPHKAVSFAREIGVEPASYNPEVHFGSEHDDAVDEFLRVSPSLSGRKLIAINRTTAQLYRYWPIEKFEALRDLLVANGYAVILCYTPITRAGELAIDGRAVQTEGPHLGSTEELYRINASILTMAALFRRCEAVVTVDTGLLHIAAATQTPTVGIFTNAPPYLVAPLGGRVVSLRAGVGVDAVGRALVQLGVPVDVRSARSFARKAARARTRGARYLLNSWLRRMRRI